MAAIAGALPRPIPAQDGILSWRQIEAEIRPKTYYFSQTALVSLENTHNMAGGTLYPPEVSDEICDRAHDAGLRVHLDGARIFNASSALGATVARLSRTFDSVTFSLSKRLGAGMRQVGILADAALMALEESPKRLVEDHENARRLAEALAAMRGVTLDPKKVRTNIVIFGIESSGKTAADVCAGLAKRGVLASGVGKQSIRVVTHCDVDRAGIERAIAALNEILGAKV